MAATRITWHSWSFPTMYSKTDWFSIFSIAAIRWSTLTWSSTAMPSKASWAAFWTSESKAVLEISAKTFGSSTCIIASTRSDSFILGSEATSKISWSVRPSKELLVSTIFSLEANDASAPFPPLSTTLSIFSLLIFNAAESLLILFTTSWQEVLTSFVSIWVALSKVAETKLGSKLPVTALAATGRMV